MNSRERDSIPTETGSDLERLLRSVAGGDLSRREFFVRAAALGVSASAIGTILAACGEKDDTSGNASPEPLDTTLPKKIFIYNWSDYMSPKCLKDFEKQYGVQCVETYYDGNEALAAKLKAGATGYDVIFPTDMWVSVLSKTGLLMPLDMNLIPNFKNVTQPVFQKPVFDNPDDQGGKKYSVPYMFGTTGFAATLAKVPDPGDSWNILWDEQYKRQISMLNAPRETLGVGLMIQGFSPNTTSQEELDKAVAKLQEQKPLVLKYDSVNTRRSIVQGFPLTHCWDGDVGLALKEISADTVKYVLPTEGYIVWADGIAIPKGAPSPYAAHLFLNFMLDPKNAGEASNYIGYQCVVEAGMAYVTNPIQKEMRPTLEMIASGKLAQDVGNFARNYDQAWEQVVSA